MSRKYLSMLAVLTIFLCLPANGFAKGKTSKSITLDKSMIEGDLHKPMHIPVVILQEGRDGRVQKNLKTAVTIKRDFKELVESVLGRNDTNDVVIKEE